MKKTFGKLLIFLSLFASLNLSLIILADSECPKGSDKVEGVGCFDKKDGSTVKVFDKDAPPPSCPKGSYRVDGVGCFRNEDSATVKNFDTSAPPPSKPKPGDPNFIGPLSPKEREEAYNKQLEIYNKSEAEAKPKPLPRPGDPNFVGPVDTRQKPSNKPVTGGVDPNASNQSNNTNQAAVNQDSSAQTRTNPTTNNRSSELTHRNSSTTTNNSINSSSNNSSDPSRSSNGGASNSSYSDGPSTNSKPFKSAQYGGIASTGGGPVQSNQGIGGYADSLVNQFGLPTDFLGQLVQIFTQLLQTFVNALLGLVQSLIGGFNPIQQPNYLQNPNSNIANFGNQLGLGGGNILGGQLLGPIAGGALNIFPQNQYPQNFNPTQFISTATNTFPLQTIGDPAQSLLQSTTYNPIFNNLIGGQSTNGIQQIANNIAQSEQNTLFSTQSVIREIKYPRGTVFKGETINVNGKLVANGKGVKYFNSTLPGAYSSCEGTFQNGQADCLYNNGDRWIGFDLEDPNTIGYGTIIKKDGTKISGTYQGDKLISK